MEAIRHITHNSDHRELMTRLVRAAMAVPLVSFLIVY